VKLSDSEIAKFAKEAAPRVFVANKKLRGKSDTESKELFKLLTYNDFDYRGKKDETSIKELGDKLAELKKYTEKKNTKKNAVYEGLGTDKEIVTKTIRSMDNLLREMKDTTPPKDKNSTSPLTIILIVAAVAGLGALIFYLVQG